MCVGELVPVDGPGVCCPSKPGQSIRVFWELVPVDGPGVCCPSKPGQSIRCLGTSAEGS